MTALAMCPKLGEMVQICNPSILEVSGGRLPQIQGQPGLHRERDLVSKNTQRSHVRYGSKILKDCYTEKLWKNNKTNQQLKTTTATKENSDNLQLSVWNLCWERGVPADLFWSPSDPFLSLCRSPSSAITFHRRIRCAFKQAGLKILNTSTWQCWGIPWDGRSCLMPDWKWPFDKCQFLTTIPTSTWVNSTVAARNPDVVSVWKKRMNTQLPRQLQSELMKREMSLGPAKCAHYTI